MQENGELKLTAKDGERIDIKIFYPRDNPKGVLIICHGFGEHIERYSEFTEYLTENNYACIVFDQRGHGKKCNKKTFGIIPYYDSFLDDIDTIKTKAISLFPQIPLFLYGHSMGGNIAVSYLLNRDQNSFKGAILETPWLRLYKPIKAPIVALARMLGKMSPNWAIVNKLNVNYISKDVERNTEISKDKLYHNRISFRMFTGINDAGEYAISNAEKLSIPIFLVCAEEDKIVCSKAIKEFGDKAKPNVLVKLYEKTYHSVHNDVNKKTYINDLVEFLNSLIC